MSFGFHSPQPKIQKAIKQAAFDNILMFAAASNQGMLAKPTFPANDASVFCIYATDGVGNSYTWNARTEPRSMNFSTPGIALKSSWLEDDKGFEVRRSGTSFATPVAVAIAACILEFCVQQSMAHENFTQLKTLSGMRRVLRGMSVDCKGLDCICPSELFRKDCVDKSEILRDIEKAMVP